MTAAIAVEGEPVGRVEVGYTEPMPAAHEGPFLAEERRLLEAVAERVGQFVGRRRLQRALLAHERPATGAAAEWGVVLEFLRQTDRALLARLGRKMINHLCWSGVEDAERLLRDADPTRSLDEEAGEGNRPRPRTGLAADPATTEAAFRIADLYLPEHEILNCIQSWIREDKSTFLKNALERMDTPLAELADALQRFSHGGVLEKDLSTATQMELRAALVRRFLTDQLDFVNIAKEYLDVADFHELCQRIVYPPRSHGRVGGKSAGLFLASRMVARSPEYHELLGGIRLPRSWHIPSDGILDFIHHNDLDDVYNRKYVDPDRVRIEYPYIVQLFKNSFFSPDILRGLSDVLDDLEGRPIIVRSSSLLEDRLGAAFSGKYKSLFLANTGSQARAPRSADRRRSRRSTPRSSAPTRSSTALQRGLLDLHEEMGILIQEVVGTRVGQYWLPAFSGVGFSNNEFRWSPRIRREDGLLRMVPGLGTRAVDRLADDYPVLLAPGQPGLRVNQTPEEVLRYSPKKADVINLETGSLRDGRRRTSCCSGTATRCRSCARWSRSPTTTTCAGRSASWTSATDDGGRDLRGAVRATRPFVARMRALLQVLREKLKTPVDIEFASRRAATCTCCSAGRRARPRVRAAVPIPRDVPPERLLFTARRYVSNGQVGDITHVVYVDPDGLRSTSSSTRIREVGRAVGRLNRVLPKRQFILIGTGALGHPRRHPPRRARDLRRHQQHGRAGRGGPPEGRLRARPLVRHALLPGPRRVLDPLPAALPGRPAAWCSTRPSCSARPTPWPTSPPSSRSCPTCCG